MRRRKWVCSVYLLALSIKVNWTDEISHAFESYWKKCLHNIGYLFVVCLCLGFSLWWPVHRQREWYLATFADEILIKIVFKSMNPFAKRQQSRNVKYLMLKSIALRLDRIITSFFLWVGYEKKNHIFLITLFAVSNLGYRCSCFREIYKSYKEKSISGRWKEKQLASNAWRIHSGYPKCEGSATTCSRRWKTVRFTSTATIGKPGLRAMSPLWT